MADASAVMGGAAQGAALGASVGGPAAPITAAIGGVIGGITGFMSSKKAKKQAAAAQAEAQRIAAQREAAMTKLLAEIDESDKKRVADSIAAYTQIKMLQDQALADGKRDIADQFATMSGLLETNLQAELTAVGANYNELKKEMDGFATDARGLLQGDLDAQANLRKAYEVDTAKVIPTLKKGMEASQTRLDELQRRGGLSPEASAVLSKASEGLKQARVKFDQSEALNQTGGKSSRKAGFDIEAVKALSEVNASLRAAGAQEAMALRGETAQAAGQLANAAAAKQQALQDTSGAQKLALEGQLQAKKEGLIAGRQAQELAATTGAGAQRMDLQGQRGAQELAMTQGYAQAQQAGAEGQMVTLNNLEQQRAAHRVSLESARTGIAMSISDVLMQQAGQLQRDSATAMNSAVLGFGQAGMGAYQIWKDKRDTASANRRNAQDMATPIIPRSAEAPLTVRQPSTSGFGSPTDMGFPRLELDLKSPFVPAQYGPKE